MPAVSNVPTELPFVERLLHKLQALGGYGRQPQEKSAKGIKSIGHRPSTQSRDSVTEGKTSSRPLTYFRLPLVQLKANNIKAPTQIVIASKIVEVDFSAVALVVIEEWSPVWRAPKSCVPAHAKNRFAPLARIGSVGAWNAEHVQPKVLIGARRHALLVLACPSKGPVQDKRVTGGKILADRGGLDVSRAPARQGALRKTRHPLAGAAGFPESGRAVRPCPHGAVLAPQMLFSRLPVDLRIPVVAIKFPGELAEQILRRPRQIGRRQKREHFHGRAVEPRPWDDVALECCAPGAIGISCQRVIERRAGLAEIAHSYIVRGNCEQPAHVSSLGQILPGSEVEQPVAHNRAAKGRAGNVSNVFWLLFLWNKKVPGSKCIVFIVAKGRAMPIVRP